MLNDKDKDYLLSHIRNVENFPKEGIVFKDITTLLNDAKAFNFLIEHLSNRYKSYNLDFVAGIDSRGFIFGAALAVKLGIGFVPIRKKGKLPSATISEKYALEYGFDEVEIHLDAFKNKIGAKVLLCDDLCATGGTASAAAKLVKDAKGSLEEVCFILNLTFLDGYKKVSQYAPVYNVLNI